MRTVALLIVMVATAFAEETNIVGTMMNKDLLQIRSITLLSASKRIAVEPMYLRVKREVGEENKHHQNIGIIQFSKEFGEKFAFTPTFGFATDGTHHGVAWGQHTTYEPNEHVELYSHVTCHNANSAVECISEPLFEAKWRKWKHAAPFFGVDVDSYTFEGKRESLLGLNPGLSSSWKRLSFGGGPLFDHKIFKKAHGHEESGSKQWDTGFKFYVAIRISH